MNNGIAPYSRTKVDNIEVESIAIYLSGPGRLFRVSFWKRSGSYSYNALTYEMRVETPSGVDATMTRQWSPIGSETGAYAEAVAIALYVLPQLRVEYHERERLDREAREQNEREVKEQQDCEAAGRARKQDRLRERREQER